MLFQVLYMLIMHMNMVINEFLRLCPPVLCVTRKVKREVKLGKLVSLQTLSLNLPNIALYHDTHIWGEDADHFKPEVLPRCYQDN